MRFLCLHGNGTNSSILNIQTAALRHELEDGHTYEFVEAVLEAPMAQGVDAFVTPESMFFAYYNPKALETLPTAIDQLNDYVKEEGPFDVILAFSAGATLAATYLLAKQSTGSASFFKGAIFLSSAQCTNELHYLRLDRHRDCIRIPTAHIWGAVDTIAPTGGKDVSELCEASMRLTMVHAGGHEVPRQESLTDAVHVLRRMLQKVDDGQGHVPAGLHAQPQLGGISV